MKATVFALAVIATAGIVAGCDDGSGLPVSTSTEATTPAEVTTEPSRSPVATTLPTRNDATVDARDFQQGDKFYFQSPTGNIMCGFINDNNFGTGCQLAKASVVPAELSGCGTQPDRAVAAVITGTTAKYLCLSQGVFVGQPLDGGTKGGGKVLEYGQTLIVRGTACTSMESGVRCDSGGHGFMIAADAQSLF